MGLIAFEYILLTGSVLDGTTRVKLRDTPTNANLNNLAIRQYQATAVGLINPSDGKDNNAGIRFVTGLTLLPGGQAGDATARIAIVRRDGASTHLVKEIANLAGSSENVCITTPFMLVPGEELQVRGFTAGAADILLRISVYSPESSHGVLSLLSAICGGESGGGTALDWKNSVRVATTAAGNFNTDFDAGSAVDGVVLAEGDSILIKDQADGTQNGIYVVNATGAPTRRSDANTDAEVTLGMACFVEAGAVNADQAWVLSSAVPNPVVLDTSVLGFTQLGGGGLPAFAAPVTIGVANAAGAAATIVRSDHVHDHGQQTQGDLHALSTAGDRGFMGRCNVDASQPDNNDDIGSNFFPLISSWLDTSAPDQDDCFVNRVNTAANAEWARFVTQAFDASAGTFGDTIIRNAAAASAGRLFLRDGQNATVFGGADDIVLGNDNVDPGFNIGMTIGAPSARTKNYFLNDGSLISGIGVDSCVGLNFHIRTTDVFRGFLSASAVAEFRPFDAGIAGNLGFTRAFAGFQWSRLFIGGLFPEFSDENASFTLDIEEFWYNCSLANMVVTCLPSNTTNQGQFTLINNEVAAESINVDPDGTDTINGGGAGVGVDLLSNQIGLLLNRGDTDNDLLRIDKHVQTYRTVATFNPSDGVQVANTVDPTLVTAGNVLPHGVWEFTDTNDGYVEFQGRLPDYYGGGRLVLSVMVAKNTANNGNVVWEVEFERHQGGVFLFSTNSFAAAVAATVAVPATDRQASYAIIGAFTNAQADSIQPGESFTMRFRRNGGSGSDTLTGDVEAASWALVEVA